MCIANSQHALTGIGDRAIWVIHIHASCAGIERLYFSSISSWVDESVRDDIVLSDRILIFHYNSNNEVATSCFLN